MRLKENVASGAMVLSSCWASNKARTNDASVIPEPTSMSVIPASVMARISWIF
ncbi:Uncharacterised protein [Mycobacteroides abscessus subsp. abscessus]|nr:Uncharacterised protein [Mycobacteroides abscessus subsp. abscessus]